MNKMSEKDLIINIEKIILGERRRSCELTTEEAIWSLRYILINIFKFTPELLKDFIDVPFLKEYDVYRYYRMIKFPTSDIKLQQKYLLYYLYPDIYKEPAVSPIDIYLKTLEKENNKRTIWDKCKNYQETNQILHWLFTILFTNNSLKEILQFVNKYPTEFIKLIKSLKLYDFYNLFYSNPLDMVFFCFSKEEQKENFKTYNDMRIKDCNDIEFEFLIQVGEKLQEEGYFQ